MTYFLGRDVEVYLTTESATAVSGTTEMSIVVDTVSGAKIVDTATATSGSMEPGFWLRQYLQVKLVPLT